MAARRIPLKSTEGYYEGLDAETRATALAIRKLVGRASPELTETLCMGVPHWAGNDYVLYIADYTNHVNLGFRKGARVRDTTGLLEGTGKGLRHVKLAKGRPLPEKQLTTLIRKAVAVDRK